MNDKLKDMLDQLTPENKHELWDDSTVQQSRVAAFLYEATDCQIGSGEDPIGFLMASHAVLAHQRNDLRQALQDIFTICVGKDLVYTLDEVYENVYGIVEKYGVIPDVTE